MDHTPSPQVFSLKVSKHQDDNCNRRHCKCRIKVFSSQTKIRISEIKKPRMREWFDFRELRTSPVSRRGKSYPRKFAISVAKKILRILGATRR